MLFHVLACPQESSSNARLHQKLALLLRTLPTTERTLILQGEEPRTLFSASGHEARPRPIEVRKEAKEGVQKATHTVV